MRRWVFAIAAFVGLAAPVHAALLMDLVDVEGIRGNQLVGYGLVVGLDGTGDRSQVRFTGQSVENMLNQFGVNLPQNTNPNLRNAAAVSITATVPPSYGPGQTMDVTVSSIGDARSLRGGQLLMAALYGADGEIYALAQGNVLVSGVQAEGRSGSRVAINAQNTGTVPNGATIEREIPTDFAERPEVILGLRSPSFQTMSRIIDAIDNTFGDGTATALNSTRVSVNAPADNNQRIQFMAMLEELEVDVGRVRPRVVFNSRTGTVVINDTVQVGAAAVAHGNLSVTISEDFEVSQPGALSAGETVVTPRTDITVEQQRGGMFQWPAGASLEHIVNTINSLGATPDDVMSILQALERAGALEAELIVM
ncbi:flagellar biosynthesis protein FlgI [Alkalilimnicola ehrlichii]|uniref:Flagellar P-ring protein n=1 Tax=Alkalilimnicola ehrlichii TaxID=351052 RepID=A0A3E0X202_9GAMM|nr:flagellar basal body P-ring protein FlgI [Alkalilimnicola ehrlichii]RFA30735.1 flagellar biosynthesis protein FlgI [Alkalilimnicola ehrlichii]RFA38311.1 flagellar biosynthesis protein FlgI [Alkalilimnicola ehrlichii]